MKTEVYDISGMSCAACSSAVERVTKKLDGVTENSVNLTTNKLTITYDENKTQQNAIIEKVEKAGFGCKLHIDEKIKNTMPKQNKELKNSDKYRLIFTWIFSLLLLYVSMGNMILHLFNSNISLLPKIFNMELYPSNFALLQILLAIPIMFLGKNFYINGFKALYFKNPNMDSLVAIGSTCSFVYSLVYTFLIPQNPGYIHNLFFESAAIVITFVMTGKYLERNSKEKTKDSIKKLMELAPDTALLVEDGKTESKAISVSRETINVGDIVLVKPGMRFPFDGKVIKGSGGVDVSIITGESIPLQKTIGDNVIGGSINGNGVFLLQVTKIGKDTVLSQIISFVENAQGKKAPISRLADKVSGIFVPVVICIALISAIVWAVLGKDTSFVLRIFTSVLVIACPCALGLATPTSIMVGTGLGALNGILIRSGQALEEISKIDTVVLDKTGTVTKGKPEVKDIICIENEKEEIMDILYTVENVSEHPLATAIVNASKNYNGNKHKYSLVSFNNIPGKGIAALVTKAEKQNTNIDVIVGNKVFMTEYLVDTTEQENQINDLSKSGKSLIFIAIKQNTTYKLSGIISVEDSIKDSSISAIELLHKQGLKVILLSGDNNLTTTSIGKLINADEIISDVLPQDKALVIEKLQKQGKKVLMVGDGVNDAPALVQADVGAAIGNGSDIALESGDLVLMKNQLTDIPKAIKLSHLTIQKIKQNLFWAFCYNTIGIPIAAGVLYNTFGILLNPMFAGAAMALSSICVVTNALSLKGKKL